MEDEKLERCLTVLNHPEIQSKEHFMVACAAEGLDVSDDEYDELVGYEIGQLKNIKAISHMFENSGEQSLFEYKKLFRLVKYAGTVTQAPGLDRMFSVGIIQRNEVRKFSVSMDMFEDMKAMHGIDTDAELWSLLKYNGLKR